MSCELQTEYVKPDDKYSLIELEDFKIGTKFDHFIDQTAYENAAKVEWFIDEVQIPEDKFSGDYTVSFRIPYSGEFIIKYKYYYEEIDEPFISETKYIVSEADDIFHRAKYEALIRLLGYVTLTSKNSGDTYCYGIHHLVYVNTEPYSYEVTAWGDEKGAEHKMGLPNTCITYNPFQRNYRLYPDKSSSDYFTLLYDNGSGEFSAYDQSSNDYSVSIEKIKWPDFYLIQ